MPFLVCAGECGEEFFEEVSPSLFHFDRGRRRGWYFVQRNYNMLILRIYIIFCYSLLTLYKTILIVIPTTWFGRIQVEEKKRRGWWKSAPLFLPDTRTKRGIRFAYTLEALYNAGCGASFVFRSGAKYKKHLGHLQGGLFVYLGLGIVSFGVLYRKSP